MGIPKARALAREDHSTDTTQHYTELNSKWIQFHVFNDDDDYEFLVFSVWGDDDCEFHVFSIWDDDDDNHRSVHVAKP